MKIVSIVPCFKCKDQILDVIARMPECIEKIYIVDDACPLQTGDFVEKNVHDERVEVLRSERNLGVGGAVKTGYRKALEENADVMVKIDGDGQIPPELTPQLIRPILAREADYCKGNRMSRMEDVSGMPFIRLLGNAGLSLITKISTGYYNIVDPTNGFTAIHHQTARKLNLDKVSNRYFFESDMLFHLYMMKAVVKDIPMKAFYGDERSNLSVLSSLFSFSYYNLKNFGKRIFQSYFLKDFGLQGLYLILSSLLFTFGLLFGSYSWWISVKTGVPATSGTVMLAALPIIVSGQLFLSFFQYDLARVPTRPLLQEDSE